MLQPATQAEIDALLTRPARRRPASPWGAERLTAQVLGLGNVREATLYPRDRHRIAP